MHSYDHKDCSLQLEVDLSVAKFLLPRYLLGRTLGHLSLRYGYVSSLCRSQQGEQGSMLLLSTQIFRSGLEHFMGFATAIPFFDVFSFDCCSLQVERFLIWMASTTISRHVLSTTYATTVNTFFHQFNTI
jgi:hypothetical protein